LKKSVLKGCLAVSQIVLLAGAVQAGNWWEDVKVKGDLRYRHEMIDAENKPTRNRERFRARIGFYGKVSPYTDVVIQLASGSDDPVSTNQTLGDAFTTKQVGIDMAYFTINHPKAPGFTLEGGKFHNPFFKAGSSELLWDSDWNPEGGALNFTRDFQNVSLTLIGAGFWIQERSSGKDSYLAAAQGVGRFNMNDKKSSVAIGVGYFNYVNTKGFQSFWDTEDSFGNTTRMAVMGSDTVEVYASDFDLLEFSAELNSQINEIPVTVMGDFVTNTAADSLETGWLVGFNLGKAKKTGSWELRYIYREVKKDAVLGLFTDSDFRGGGTDASGHELGGGYQLANNTTFNVTYFINSVGLEAAKSTDFKRLQVDLQLKF
jgi:hypothetical protein